jgi:hypothetical protein
MKSLRIPSKTRSRYSTSERYQVGNKRLSFTDLCKTGIFTIAMGFTPHIADIVVLMAHYERMALRYQDNPEVFEVMKSHYNRIHDVWRALHKYDPKASRRPFWDNNHAA